LKTFSPLGEVRRITCLLAEALANICPKRVVLKIICPQVEAQMIACPLDVAQNITVPKKATQRRIFDFAVPSLDSPCPQAMA